MSYPKGSEKYSSHQQLSNIRQDFELLTKVMDMCTKRLQYDTQIIKECDDIEKKWKSSYHMYFSRKI